VNASLQQLMENYNRIGFIASGVIKVHLEIGDRGSVMMFVLYHLKILGISRLLLWIIIKWLGAQLGITMTAK
jgi:hypothetical protein